MPLYLVRWPTLVASIVQADDEDHLIDRLDEVASPTGAVWTEYRGPLWVDVSPGLEVDREHDPARIDGAAEAAKAPLLGARLEAEPSEHTEEMFHTVLAKAFPHLYRLLDDAEPSDDPEATPELDAAAVESAARSELWSEGAVPPWLRKTFERGG
jgi:hypothetical protein